MKHFFIWVIYLMQQLCCISAFYSVGAALLSEQFREDITVLLGLYCGAAWWLLQTQKKAFLVFPQPPQPPSAPRPLFHACRLRFSLLSLTELHIVSCQGKDLKRTWSEEHDSINKEKLDVECSLRIWQNGLIDIDLLLPNAFLTVPFCHVEWEFLY